MKRIVIEGWRFMPHSYAVVNHWQLRELARRPELQIFHTDVSTPFPSWKPEAGLLDPAHEATLRAIPPRPTDPAFKPDAVLRMGWPLYFHADPSGCPTYTWGTSEFKLIEPNSIGSRRPPNVELPSAASTIIACSNWARLGFLNSGARPDRVLVNACGVDPDVFRPLAPAEREALRRDMGWEGRFVMLNISAMTPNKGILFLLHALSFIVGRHPRALLCLKGTDALYHSGDRTRMQFGQLPPDVAGRVAPHVAYLGNTLSTAQMVRLYQAADLYVTPYRAEGFNLPVLEAAACGLPSLCTEGGSTEDFIDDAFSWRIRAQEVDNVIGRVLSPDIPHLAELMDRAIGDPSFAARAREAGPAWARGRFTWKQSVDRLLAIMLPGG